MLETTTTTIAHRKAEYEKQLKSAKEHIIGIEALLERLNNCTQPTMRELYNGVDKYITYDIVKSKGVKILDAGEHSKASIPSIESRVANVTIKDGIYLGPTQIDAVKTYLFHLHQPDHVNITNSL